MSDRESVDFDFFESPKGQSKSEEVSSSGQTKSHHLKETGKGSGKREQHGSPLTSPSHRSTTPDYSSDSYESDTGSESKQQDVKKKGRLSHSSSASSLSSRSRSGAHRSRSTSASSSRSDSNRGRKSRPSDSHNGRCKTRNSKREDDYSSSAYSDDDNGKSFNSSNNVPKNAKRNAWGESQDKSSERHRSAKTRPMTAKSRPTQRKQQSRKKSDSDSEALSDSDITDVSPMESPRTQEQKKLDLVGAAGDGRVGKVRYRAMPVGPGGCDEDNEQHTPRGGLDLEILMEAVGELEKQKRVEANTRRVMFAPMTLKRGDKSNYTFDKDKTRDIERENQRLLKEIVRRVNAGDQLKQFRRPQPSASKLTPSAVNRERDIRRIETENMSILRRLQKVKPTQSISRTNQIKSYENTKLHGIPISTLHPLPKTGKRAASRADDSTSSIGSRTRSLTSLHSVTSSVRSTGSRRSSRPNSATKRVDSRPEWTDRW